MGEWVGEAVIAHPLPLSTCPVNTWPARAGQETRRGKGGGAECRDEKEDGAGKKEAERSSKKEESKCNNVMKPMQTVSSISLHSGKKAV